MPPSSLKTVVVVVVVINFSAATGGDNGWKVPLNLTVNLIPNLGRLESFFPVLFSPGTTGRMFTPSGAEAPRTAPHLTLACHFQNPQGPGTGPAATPSHPGCREPDGVPT